MPARRRKRPMNLAKLRQRKRRAVIRRRKNPLNQNDAPNAERRLRIQRFCPTITHAKKLLGRFMKKVRIHLAAGLIVFTLFIGIVAFQARSSRGQSPSQKSDSLVKP